MTERSPTSTPPTPREPRQFWQRRSTLVGLGIATTILGGGLGATLYGQYFVNEQLSPWLAAEFSKSLKRPVKLGKVERFTPNSIRFSQSEILATPTQPNFLVAPAIEVQVDLWSYWRDRQLGLDVVVDRPQIFLQQDLTGSFLPSLPSEPPAGQNPIDLRTVKVQNGQLTLQPAQGKGLISVRNLELSSNWQITNPQTQKVTVTGGGKVVLPVLGNASLLLPQPPALQKAIQAIPASQDAGNLTTSLDWDLTHGKGQVQLRSQNLAAQALQGFLPSLPFSPTQGKIDSIIDLKLSPEKPPVISGKLQVREGSVIVKQLEKPLTQVAGDLEFTSTTGNNRVSVKGLVANYGKFLTKTTGSLSDRQGFKLKTAISPISLTTALAQFNSPSKLKLEGEIQAEARVTGKINAPRLNATFTASKPITIDRATFKSVKGSIFTQDFQNLQLRQLQATPTVGGSVQGQGQIRLGSNSTGPSDLQLAFQLVGIPAEAVATWYKTKLPIAVGKISAAVQVFGRFSNPQVLAQFDAQEGKYPATGELLIANQTATLRRGNIQFPQGLAKVEGNYNLAKGNWQAQLSSTDGIALRSLAPAYIDPESDRRIFGAISLDSAGGFAANQIDAQADLQIPDGLVLKLKKGTAQIPESISLKLRWDKQNLTVANLQLGDLLSAQGKVNLGLDAQKNPKKVTGLDLALVSRQLGAERLRPFLPQLASSGVIDFEGRLSGAPEQLRLDGKLRLSEVSISKAVRAFVPQLAQNLAKGNLNFAGEVSGLINDPKLVGIANLSGLQLDRFAFAPVLSGAVNYDGNQGVNIDLRATQGSDRLAIKLSPDFQPQNLAVQLAQAKLDGNRLDGDRFNVSLQQFPLAAIASLAGQTDIQGTVNSQLVVDLTGSVNGNARQSRLESLGTPSITALGEITIDRPRFRQIQAEKLTANLSYANGTIRIREGIAALGNSVAGSYGFELDIAPQADQIVKGKVLVNQGRLADVLATMQLFQISDLARGMAAPNLVKARDLAPLKAIGLGEMPLYKQLEYFSQINAKLEQEEAISAQRNINLPPLSQAQGEFDGAISFANSRSQGLSLGFDLTGKQWEYGKFAIADIVAQGSLQKNLLSLTKLKLQSGDRLGQIADAQISLNLLTGKISSLDLLVPQKGKVILANFPIEALRPFPLFQAIPFNLTGNVDSNATIGGTLLNPIVSGKIKINDATINREALKSVDGDFALKDFQLRLNATALVSGSEPLTVAGVYPILGGALDLAINVKDEGLAFINLINPTVQWASGKGKGSLVVSGTTRSPRVKGKVTLNNATFQIVGLPADLTDVSGEIDFGLDRLNADLAGKFSEGKITAKGLLAIADANLNLDNPLQISAEKLKLNIKDLYEGDANGNVVIKGSVQAPVLSGEVALSDGRINLGGDSPSFAQTNGGNTAAPSPLRFDALLVKLTDKIQLTRLPLLNFLAEGKVTLNGSLGNLLPSGRIDIIRGQVNAISTRFNLDRAFDNYATFTPEQGLNPTLNVRVAGVVPEISRTPTASSLIDTFNPTNVPVSAPGATRSLRVNATVTGSSQNPDIQLTSSPPRTQAEILALIGGGLLQQGGGDPTAALVNLAGGTVISFLQDLVGDVFSLSEFNLTPTTATPVGGKTSTLGFAAEAAIDITKILSFSVRAVINDPSQPTSYTVRYRVDPSTLVRTTTDLKGNNSASVEFETRF